MVCPYGGSKEAGVRENKLLVRQVGARLGPNGKRPLKPGA